jgi:hypothetical protein
LENFKTLFIDGSDLGTPFCNIGSGKIYGTNDRDDIQDSSSYQSPEQVGGEDRIDLGEPESISHSTASTIPMELPG